MVTFGIFGGETWPPKSAYVSGGIVPLNHLNTPWTKASIHLRIWGVQLLIRCCPSPSVPLFLSLPSPAPPPSPRGPGNGISSPIGA